MDKFPIDDVIVDMFAFYEKKVYLKDHHIEGYFFLLEQINLNLIS